MNEHVKPPSDDDSWLEGGSPNRPKKQLRASDFEAVESDLKIPFRFDMTKLPEMLDYAEESLLDAGAPLYQTGGRVVHPVRHDKDSDNQEPIRHKAGALIIRDVSALRLREYMIQHAPFSRLSKKGDDLVYCAAPVQLASHYLARVGEWRLPVLRGLIETPTLRKDGSLLFNDGYDKQSGLLLDKNGVEYPKMEDRPSKHAALAALKTLKWPFKDFPFIEDELGDSPSRSVMLSAVLTALVRRSLYSAPVHGFDAPMPGTGKTLACNSVSMIATGRFTTAMSQGANEEEDEKRLFSVLLTGDSIILIDNVSRPIEGNALCTVLSEPMWKCRILGENREVEVPTSALFLASGNNLTFKGDMITRALVCRMDAGIERPETRSFDIDLKVEIPKRRAELVIAGLTILRAFIVANRPGLDTLEPFGRFEDWSNLVRGSLVWLGEPDPCETRNDIATDDPDRNALGSLLTAIHEIVGDEWISAGQLIKLTEDRENEDGLLTAIYGVAPHANREQVGHYLKTHKDRIIGNLKLTGRYDTHQKLWTYRVEEVCGCCG
jgi:hypothetical protein